jgi:2'-5' RNA ligase
MLYFVGYLIEGEASNWHRKLTADISKRFDVEDQDKRIPPHITIFRPFETDDISETYELIKNWVSDKSIPGNFQISGFDRFNKEVVFTDVRCDTPVREFVRAFQEQMDTLHIPDKTYPEWRPHATIAHRIPQGKIDQIWQHVSTLPPYSFDLTFNNLTIFKHTGDRKWEV